MNRKNLDLSKHPGNPLTTAPVSLLFFGESLTAHFFPTHLHRRFVLGRGKKAAACVQRARPYFALARKKSTPLRASAEIAHQRKKIKKEARENENSRSWNDQSNTAKSFRRNFSLTSEESGWKFLASEKICEKILEKLPSNRNFHLTLSF